MINYVGFGLVTAASTAATSASTAATTAAASTAATTAAASAATAAAASAGEHRVVDHKTDLSAQVLYVVDGRLFQEGSTV